MVKLYKRFATRIHILCNQIALNKGNQNRILINKRKIIYNPGKVPVMVLLFYGVKSPVNQVQTQRFT